jgi:uncharacterized protein YkwD
MTIARVRSLVVSVLVPAFVAAMFVAPSAHAGLAHASSGHAYRPVPAEPRARILGLVNRTRVLRDLPRLLVNKRLSDEAYRHSRRMAHDDELSHTPDLAALIHSEGGTVFGENIARGRGLRGIRDAWLRRPDTRSILLDPRFLHVGLGVAHIDGFFWVTLQAFD